MRMIDGDRLLRELTALSHGQVWPGWTYEGIRLLIDRQPTLTPPNEPLTLEQLRKMDGEPVWIVEYPDWGHWELSEDADDYLADRDPAFYGMKHDDPDGRYGLHALGWLSYRRPLEED